MIMSAIQMSLMCDGDSVGQGPVPSSLFSPRPGSSWGDDKYLLHVDQAVVVTVIIFVISVGVMLQCSRCQQQAGLPHFLMAGEASGKQMLSEDEQQGGPGSGWAFSLESQSSKHHFGVAGSGHICVLLLSPQSKATDILVSGDIEEECYGAGTFRLKGPNPEGSSTFLGSLNG